MDDILHNFCGTYALKCPYTMTIKYIGTSTNAIRRLGNHISDGASYIDTILENKYDFSDQSVYDMCCHKLYKWIGQLLLDDALPKLDMIHVYHSKLEYQEYGYDNERYWIAYYTLRGTHLFNDTYGSGHKRILLEDFNLRHTNIKLFNKRIKEITDGRM